MKKILKSKVTVSDERQITFYIDVKQARKIRKIAEQHDAFISEVGRTIISIGLPILEQRLKGGQEDNTD